MSFDAKEYNLDDDGGCNHLLGTRLPSLSLDATDGSTVDLSQLKNTIVVYCYPRTGRPDQPVASDWLSIPGASGCTPQSCAFRDQHNAYEALDVKVFGLSTQDTEYQRETVTRLHLTFPLLSDENLSFVKSLALPTFSFEGMTLIKRLTIIINNGEIIKVFYPINSPDKNAEDVLAYLKKLDSSSNEEL